jgi:hypothetical protein
VGAGERRADSAGGAGAGLPVRRGRLATSVELFAAIGALLVRFNSNHDPANGEFSRGGNGRLVRVPKRGIMFRSIGRSRVRTPAELPRPLP